MAQEQQNKGWFARLIDYVMSFVATPSSAEALRQQKTQEAAESNRKAANVWRGLAARALGIANKLDPPSKEKGQELPRSRGPG